jgi:hypothetical protein
VNGASCAKAQIVTFTGVVCIALLGDFFFFRLLGKFIRRTAISDFQADGVFLQADGSDFSSVPLGLIFRLMGFVFGLTSKMSHGGKWRRSCESTNCDIYRSWLHRFVRLIVSV